MARRALVVLAFLGTLSIPIARAGERLRVVVNDLDANGVSREVARVASDHLRVKLIETRRFVIPEREKMEAIIAEQAVGVQLGDCVSQDCAVQLGRLLEANKMIVGTISLLNQTYSMSIRFLDLTTGAAEFSAEEKCQSVDDLFAAAERLAARTVAFVPPRGHVVAVSDENFIVDLGGLDGVTPGMTFRILRAAERVPGYPEEEPIAMARATAVQEDWSRLEAERTAATLMRRPVVQVGDVAVGPQTVAVEELPQYAFLMIYSRPIGAEVYVDNLFQGRTKNGGLEVRLAAGHHAVRIAAPAHRPDERTVDLQPGQRMPYNATLEPVLPHRASVVPLTTLSYVRQRPGNDRFRGMLDGEALQGAQIGFGRIQSFFITELGASWTYANMAPGQGYGLNETHRLGAYVQAGLATRMGLFIPYLGIGYEAAQLMFDEGNVFKGTEDPGSAGKLADNGWYWTAGVFVHRWLHVSMRGTWGHPETDLKMITAGLNLSGFRR